MKNNKACILFDIDGTLSNSTGLGGEAMLEAGRQLYGPQFTLEGISFAGSVDPKVYQQICLLNDLNPVDIDETKFQERYIALLDHKLQTSPERVQALPGAHALVEDCKTIEGLTLGVLTGNYSDSGKLKLSSTGFDPGDFHIHAFADVHDCRRELAAHALVLVDEYHELPIDPARIFILGDTSHDIDCALHNGMRAIGVATGRYSVDQLTEAGAELVMPDLLHAEPFIELIKQSIR